MFSRTHEAPTQRGFGSGFLSRDDGVSPGAFIFSPSGSSFATDKPTATSGFSNSNPFVKNGSSAASGSSLFTAVPSRPSTAPSAFGDQKINPMGRGRSTRECFEANEDRRFAKPAFYQKPSAWAAIAALSKAQPGPANRGGFTFQPRETSVFSTSLPSQPLFGVQPSATTSQQVTPNKPFEPIAYVDHLGQTGRMYSISAMPEHANQSFEELRFSGAATPHRSLFGTNPSSSVGSTDTFVFGGKSDMESVAPSTSARKFTFGVDSWNPSLAEPSRTVFGGGPFFGAGGSDVGVGKFDFKPTTSFGPPASSKPVVGSFDFKPATTFGPTASSKSVVGSFDFKPTTTFGPTAPSKPTNPFSPHSAVGSGLPSFIGEPKQNPDLATKLRASWTGPHFHLDPPSSAVSNPTPKPEHQSLFSFRRDASSSATGPLTFNFGVDKSVKETPLVFSFEWKNENATVDSTEGNRASAQLGLPSLSPQTPHGDTAESIGNAESTDSAEPASLALPKPKTSYANITGSRATAFIRRSRQTSGKATVAESQRLVIATMMSSRKPSPTKKPVERIVVGRKDAELRKRCGSKASLFVESAEATALAMQQPQDEETKAESDDENAPRGAENSSTDNLDDYDL